MALRWLAAAARALVAALLCCALAMLVLSNTAKALNIYQDMFVTLSARPLSMGGAFAALCGPESVFYNPAGLAGLRNFTLMHNHSSRHFPGSTEGGMGEWDQLDGDTQCIAVPLPLATFAHGFTFSGEMGYDFRGHPDDYRLGYPREQYWGGEDYDALAFSCGLPFAVGVSERRHFGRFTHDPVNPRSADWFRLGEGTQWGILARVWPGVDYGHSELDMDYDWTTAGGAGGIGFGSFTSTMKSKREGWSFHPVGWFTHASDKLDTVQYIEDLGWISAVHMGTNMSVSIHSGNELCLGALGKLRWGSYDGRDTVGCAINLGGIWFNYAEVENLLPDIVGAGEGFEDIHIYGFDWRF